MNIASRDHAVALGLADVWDREMGGATRRVATGPAAPVQRGGRRPTSKNELGQNKTEAMFDGHLADLKQSGRIRDHRFELLKWRLAGRTWLAIDFAVWMPDGRLIAVDVKGWLEDDSAVKVKVLAEQCPLLPVYLVSYQRGAWTYRVCGRGGIVHCAAPF